MKQSAPRIFFALLLFFCANQILFAQSTQTLRGEMQDRETRAKLEGGKVAVFRDSVFVKGVLTDSSGRFRFDELPVGRYTVRGTYLGYNEQVLPDLILTSGKELVLNLELEESMVQLEKVEITASSRDESINEMATVSARTFNIENTDRYAGSRGDPARMAANFAGVRGSDDSRNDIVIRGNSPFGLMYRLEGMDIPNPNHFSIFGSTGGPVGMLSNKVLTHSDFFTGAFPAEYGNALAGAFDLRMRNGNNERHEFGAQIGFLGMEAIAEGPLSKKSRASYLATYRYSTLSLIEAMGIPYGIGAVPKYQDGSFKLNFPLKGGHNFSVFGMAGKSDIEILNCKRDTTDVFDTEIGKDVHFGSAMAVGGMNYLRVLNDKTWMRVGIIAHMQNSYSRYDTNNVVTFDCGTGTLSPYMRLNYGQSRAGTHIVLNHKFNARLSLRSGLLGDYLYFSAYDSTWRRSQGIYLSRADTAGSTFLVQAYVQIKYKITEKLSLNAGIHGQYIDLSKSSAPEPRIGFRYSANEKHAYSIAYGFHSQTQPFQVYWQTVRRPDGSITRPHTQLGFTRSQHIVAGWDWRAGRNLRTKLEIYYQRISNAPVEVGPSSFSLLNQGSGFDMLQAERDLVNAGKGFNYGAEITVEKFYAKSYFFLATASLYNSRYAGSDGVWRNTNFNGRYIVNVLGGKEFKFGKNKDKVINLGPKFTWGGGNYYSPIDTLASQADGEAVIVDSLAWSQQLKNYLRFDLRISFRLNAKRASHEIALDLINPLNVRNELTVTYNPRDNSVRAVPQLGFLPIFYYRIEFGIGKKRQEQ